MNYLANHMVSKAKPCAEGVETTGMDKGWRHTPAAVGEGKLMHCRRNSGMGLGGSEQCVAIYSKLTEGELNALAL